MGGELSGNGSDGGDVGLLADGVGVGGGAPWGFGLGPHRGGNSEEGDGGGGGFTLAADCCPGCVCRFGGGGSAPAPPKMRAHESTLPGAQEIFAIAINRRKRAYLQTPE